MHRRSKQVSTDPFSKKPFFSYCDFIYHSFFYARSVIFLFIIGYLRWEFMFL